MKSVISAIGVLAFRGSATRACSAPIQQQPGGALNALAARFAAVAQMAAGRREAVR